MASESDTCELKMRCVEAAARMPFSDHQAILAASRVLYDWIVEPPAPPQGRTSAARKRLEESKR